MVEIRTEDLPDLIKLQFIMVAETAAEVIERTGNRSPFKISAVVKGRKITAVIGEEVTHD